LRNNAGWAGLLENVLAMNKENLEIPDLVGTKRAAEILGRSPAVLKF